jgi:hypothetical protein
MNITDLGTRIKALSASAKRAWQEVEAATTAELIYTADAIPAALLLMPDDGALKVPYATMTAQFAFKAYCPRHLSNLDFILKARTDPTRSDVTHLDSLDVRTISPAALARIAAIVEAGNEWEADPKRAELEAVYKAASATAEAFEQRLTALQGLIVDLPAKTPQELGWKALALAAAYCHADNLKEASEAILENDVSLAGRLTASIILDLKIFVDQPAMEGA